MPRVPCGYERQFSTTTRSAADAVATTAQATAKTTRRARVEFMAKFSCPAQIFRRLRLVYPEEKTHRGGTEFAENESKKPSVNSARLCGELSLRNVLGCGAHSS